MTTTETNGEYVIAELVVGNPDTFAKMFDKMKKMVEEFSLTWWKGGIKGRRISRCGSFIIDLAISPDADCMMDTTVSAKKRRTNTTLETIDTEGSDIRTGPKYKFMLDDEQEVTSVVNLETLHRVLALGNSADTIKLSLMSFSPQGEPSSLKFHADSREYQTYMEVTLLALDGDEKVEINPVAHQFMFSMPSTEFQKALREMGGAAEGKEIAFRLVSDNNGGSNIEVTVTGTMNSPCVRVINGNRSEEMTITNISLEPPDPSETERYSIGCLREFASLYSCAHTVAVFVGYQVPIKVNYRVPDIGYITLYLAPKISE